MAIFNKDKNSGIELEQLKEELQKSQSDFSRIKIHLVKSKTDIVTLTRQLDQANEELRAAKKALREFQDQDVRTDDVVATVMLQLPGQSQWVDPNAVWHISIDEAAVSLSGESSKSHQGQHALYLNKQFVMHGTKQTLQDIVSQIIKAKQQSTDGG